MISRQSLIDLEELSLLLLNLLCESCEILHSFSSCPNLCWKGENNPVTELDFLLQEHILTAIKKRYGDSITIVAEEDFTSIAGLKFKKSNELKLSEFCRKKEPASLPQKAKFTRKLNAEDICLWVDPVDCTQGLINGRLHQVTMLIGLTFQGHPIAGLIAHPYKPSETNKKESIYQPTVYFGSTEFGLKSAYEYSLAKQTWRERKGFEESDCFERIATVGYRQMSERMEKLVKGLGLKLVRAGGAGYKCVKLINKEVGSIIFIDAKTSKWDTCAGEAIIRAMGGFSLCQTLSQIDYNEQKIHEKTPGFIFSLSDSTKAAFTSLLPIL